jgi:surface antigen
MRFVVLPTTANASMLPLLAAANRRRIWATYASRWLDSSMQRSGRTANVCALHELETRQGGRMRQSLSRVVLIVFVSVAMSAVPAIVEVGRASAVALPCTSFAYECTPDYTGDNASGSWAWTHYGPPYANTPTGIHNCTLYAAWRLQQSGMTTDPGNWGDAKDWANNIGGGNHTPVVGSIAWYPAAKTNGFAGHVAFVEQVNGTRVLLTADNFSSTGGYTSAGWVSASSVGLFLHPHDVSAPTLSVPTFINGGVSLTFTAPGLPPNTSVRYYDYEVSNDGGSTINVYNTMNPTSPETVTGCDPNWACAFRIRANFDGGISPWSSWVGVKGLPAPTLKVPKFVNGGVSLTFTAPVLPSNTSVRYYDYEVSNDGGSTIIVYNTMKPTSPEAVTGCDPNWACAFRIRAHVDAGITPWTGWRTAG